MERLEGLIMPRMLRQGEQDGNLIQNAKAPETGLPDILALKGSSTSVVLGFPASVDRVRARIPWPQLKNKGNPKP